MRTHHKVALAVGTPALILLVTELAAWDGGYFQWYYVAPIAALAPWLVIHRWAEGPPGHRLLVADGLAVFLAGLRIIGPFVPASGHVLFLVYSFATIRHPWYRVGAGLVFGQVVWLKLIAWREWGSVTGGIIAGLLLIAVAGPIPGAVTRDREP